jgi:predicted nucleotidyltransferase
MTNSIVREFSPERIVLFGSYAYGTPTDDSDVELLIVMPLTEEWTR